MTELESVKAENKQLHLTLARTIEGLQKGLREEVEKQQGYLDRLFQKINNLERIIKYHEMMGGKDVAV